MIRPLVGVHHPDGGTRGELAALDGSVPRFAERPRAAVEVAGRRWH